MNATPAALAALPAAAQMMQLRALAGSAVVVPVILAGGSGTRLWPLSREQFPKQFLPLLGKNSLFQDTLLRASRLDNAAPPVVIGSKNHRFLLAEQIQETGIAGVRLILEPEGRNTAPAAAIAAHQIAEEYGPEAMAFLMSADHAIPDENAFADSARAAVAAANRGNIVIFGIRPTRAETGFGYIEFGAPLADQGALSVTAFVEKPSLDVAQGFLSNGRHLWNAGLFLFRSGDFLEELKRLEPELADSAWSALSDSARDGDQIEIDLDAFRACRADSVDKAVMERSDRLAMVPLDAGWDDVGCWSFMGNQPPTDNEGNVARGDVVLQGSRGNLVHSNSRLVALVDVDDLVVVETEDAVLVTRRERAQEVKRLVDKLKADAREEAKSPPRVQRPWGTYETIASGERFQVKRIIVKPGAKLSLQMHHHRAEHWVVVKGTAQVTCGDKQFLLSENQSTYIPLGQCHRLENPGMVPLEVIEVQSGAYLGEDDIVRFEDQYGRSVSVTHQVTETMQVQVEAPPATIRPS